MFKHSVNHTSKFFIAVMILLGVAASAIFSQTEPVDAYGLLQTGPERKAVLSISYTTYEWWLLPWNNSQLICKIYVEHEGWPEPAEVEYYCGKQVLNDWLDTSACEFSDVITEPRNCPGLYLHLTSITPGEREIEVDLLPPQVFVDIANCDPELPEHRCETLPALHLMGEEPLPNETIISIQGQIGAEPFSCQGADCIIPLPPTGMEGIQINFWAQSSFGDASDTYTAQVRVVPWGDFVAPDVQTEDNPQWYVDILSSQYLGKIESTCSQIWSSFPPVGGPPPWLSSPDHPDGLISNRAYYYLAGSLITQGMVDVSACPGGGLLPSGVANQCGVESAQPVISTWQNQFNAEIIQVSQDTGVPAQLIKNIFSRESQFWPGYSASYQESGLGHLSDLGADTVLLWNPNFFSQFCPLVLDTTVCQRGFGNLDLAEQEMLRGALVQKVNAACPECPQGIDLRQANFSISIFARSILANCEQVGQIIYNYTRRPAGEVSHYEDLWRFTLVNYNAGSGCLSNAIELTINNNLPLTWNNLVQFLEPGACQASIAYVEDIALMPEAPRVTPTATILAPMASTPTPTSLPTQPVEEPPAITPTPSATDYGYPPPRPTYAPPYP